MKKTILLAFVTAVLAAGCASTGTATSTTATQPMTLEEALQNRLKPAKNYWKPNNLTKTRKLRPK